MLLAPATPGPGLLHLSGLTDSQVSSHVVRKGSSTSFPLCVVSMELAAQLEARSAVLELSWVPRGVNGEADRLAEGDYAGFDLNQRVGTDLAALPFAVLPALMDAGLRWHQAAAARASAGSGPSLPAGPSGASAGRPRRQPFKEREPW